MNNFTTGQVAKICEVAPRTVTNWFDSNQLGGFRLPNSLFRHIPRSDLIQFLRDNGMDRFEDRLSLHTILFTEDRGLVDIVSKILQRDLLSVKTSAARNLFEAGLALGNNSLDCVLVDSALGVDKITTIDNWLSTNQVSPPIRALLLHEGGVAGDNWAQSEVFRKPLDPALLAVRLSRSLAELEK